MSKSLYERSLEALVEKLEARIVELEKENVLLAQDSGIGPAEAESFPLVFVGQVWEHRAGQRLPVTVTDVGEVVVWESQSMTGSCSAFFWHWRMRLVSDRPASLPFDSAPHVSAPAPAKRLNDDEKRAILTAAGWTEHGDILQQNISVCWERGAQWYHIGDAYDLLIAERDAERLRVAGWEPLTGIDEREVWRDPISGDCIPREYAVARLSVSV